MANSTSAAASRRLKKPWPWVSSRGDRRLEGRDKECQKVRRCEGQKEKNISLFPLDLNIADQAVELRAQHHFKTPDAIQLGTAVACGADYIITNDKEWQRVEEIQIVMVGDL